MKKKRILYICSEAAPGMIPFATAIIKAALKSSQLDIYAIAVDDRLSYKPFIENTLKRNITFLEIPQNKIKKYFNKIYAYEILREAKKMCKRYNIDAIHLLTGDYTCNLIINKLKKLATVYYTVHDLQTHEMSYKGIKDRLFMKYSAKCVNHIIKQTDNLVTCSKEQFETIKKQFSHKKAYYQPFPSLVTEDIEKGDAICPELKGEENYILSFGNIDIYKGTIYLYEAFTKHLQGFKNKLVIAGNGKIYFPHENIENVIFINRYIKDEEIKSLFEKAACVVYPYISATQTGVLSIAYKFKTPAIVSNIPFFKESATEDTCLFFERANSKDLAIKIEQIICNLDIIKMKRMQSEFYESHYSGKSLTTAIETIYKA